MKKKLLRLCSCVIALILVLGCLLLVIHITNRKSSIAKYQDFFEQEEDFDVLFLGSSHMLNAVYPMQLWNDHGIVSYNFGGHSNRIATSYWVMKNALEYTSPKLVVVDCFELSLNTKVFNQYQYLHISLDAFPVNSTKIAAVKDLLPDGEVENAAKLRSEMLFPFSSYHNRWSELTKEDFDISYNTQKGAEARVDVAEPKTVPEVPADLKLTNRSVSWDYLERLIEECQSRNIQVLLVYLPFPAYQYNFAEAQTVPDIAEKYGVRYIDFLNMDLVDYGIDCYDANSHLNPSGAYKVTEYLGQYISENYTIADRRNDPAYAEWHDDYQAYLEHRQSLFRDKAKSAQAVLSLMKEDSMNYIIRADGSALAQRKITDLLKNLGVDPGKIAADGGYILINNTKGTIEYLDEQRILESGLDSTLGTLTLTRTEESVTLSLGEAVLLDTSREAWDSSSMHFFVLEGTKCRVVKSLNP